MFKNLFKKSYNIKNIFSSSIFGTNYDFDNNVINFYLQSSPVFIATNMVSNAVADINFVIHDKKQDKIIYNHPALDLINNPNPFIDTKLFINQVVSSYLLNGNCYIHKLMSGRGEAIELYVIKSEDITINKGFDDDYPYYYYINNSNSNNFSRNSDYRFFAKNGSEIIHLMNYNPKYGANDLKGISFFSGCEYEINMYIASCVHNYNFIKSGANPSGLLTHKGDMPLTQEQAVALKQQIENTLKGSKNSGSVVVLGGDFDYKQTSQSIKDMDYQNLKEMIDRKIFQCLNIPVAKIQASAMTYSNLDVVKYDFYDNAVLPVFNTVARFLTNKVLVDYKNPDLVFTCDKSAIETLEARKITNVVNSYKNGLITRNEARTQIGYEASQNGDSFYNSATLIPAGEDVYTDDNRESPSQKELRRLMNESGLYTADEIDIEVKNAK